ncbi:hypothetical protein NIES2130_11650 [Scytonema sp. HK-05]|nr:hypothetical protein NIES2130_11650 [Scytonema sp. HK-05]
MGDETALKTSLLVGETNTKIFLQLKTPSLYGWSHSEFLADILTPFISLIFNHIVIHLPKKIFYEAVWNKDSSLSSFNFKIYVSIIAIKKLEL